MSFSSSQNPTRSRLLARGAAGRRALSVAAVTCLAAAGVEPECFLAEYGHHQFEVPCAPADGVAAADRSVTFKEVVRDVARHLGRRVTFAPLSDPAAVGNGTHIHLSLVGDAGEPLLHDPGQPGGLSRLGGQFAAGILHHSVALVALTAPSRSRPCA